MRQNWLESTSATGGTGDLTLISPGNGFPMLSAWISGVRQVRYTILEFNTDPAATNATLLRAEDGYCPLDASGPSLKRSDATTVVFTSWNGASLFPQMASATAATKQSFSVSSQNIRIICSAASEDNPFLCPIVTTTAGLGQGLGSGPLCTPGTTGGTTPDAFRLSTSGTLLYTPFVWPNIGLYSQISVRVSGGTGGTGSVDIGIYEVSKTGDPGRLLADFGTVGSLIANGVIITSGALAPPVFLVPGWYYLAVLPVFTGTQPTLASARQWASPGPLGFQINGAAGTKVAGQTAPLANPGVAATSLLTPLDLNSNSGTIPLFGLK